MMTCGSNGSQTSGLRPEIARRSGTAAAEDLSLARLLPRPPSRPPLQVRTLNGYYFWPVTGCEARDAARSLRLRRAYEVRPPRQSRLAGADMRCVIVELAPSVREWVRAELCRDLAPDDRLWDSLCRI